jgi:hypothetical protein
MVWDPLEMTEDKIQELVDGGLLRPMAEVEWKVPTCEEFPTKDDKEQVVFASYLECGFNIPTGDFSMGLLYYYKWCWYTSFPTPSF